MVSHICFGSTRRTGFRNGSREVDFSDLGLREQRDIEDWVALNPSILGEDLLIISRQFRGFDRHGKSPICWQLIRMASSSLSSSNAMTLGPMLHWQAIKYASYVRHATYGDVIDMLVKYSGISADEAANPAARPPRGFRHLKHRSTHHLSQP